MDYPIHIDTIRIEMSILYFKVLPVKIIRRTYFVSKDYFI